MRTQIIQVPYDSGYKDYRMGRGPEHILRHLKQRCGQVYSDNFRMARSPSRVDAKRGDHFPQAECANADAVPQFPGRSGQDD
jgi:hypothetical protein